MKQPSAVSHEFCISICLRQVTRIVPRKRHFPLVDGDTREGTQIAELSLKSLNDRIRAELVLPAVGPDPSKYPHT